MSRIEIWRVAVCAVIGFSAAAARAHAPPEISRIVWSPAGDRLVLVTNRGLIFKATQGATWSMMCSAALGTAPVLETEAWQEPDVAFLPDGRLLAATSKGLRATADGGCTWSAVAPFESAAAQALAQHPSEPSTLYLAVSGSTGASIQKSRDGAATWDQELALMEGEIITRLQLAPTLPTRVYATLTGAAGTIPSATLLRSSEGEAGWKRFAIPLRAGEARARVVAISPRDPDLLLVLAQAADTQVQEDRLLMSRDGGAAFSELWSSMALRDAGFGPDGTTVWIAGDAGLWRSSAPLGEVTPVGMAQLVTCAGAHDGALYVCGHHSGFDPINAGVGLSTDAGQTFQRYMAFTEVMTQVSCESASSTARACQADWTHWQLEILVGLGGAPIESVLGAAGIPDAGSADAGMADAGANSAGAQAAPSVDPGIASAADAAPAPSRAHAGSGCTVIRGAAVRFAELLVCGFAWVALVDRRRRRVGRRP